VIVDSLKLTIQDSWLVCVREREKPTVVFLVLQPKTQILFRWILRGWYKINRSSRKNALVERNTGLLTLFQRTNELPQTSLKDKPSYQLTNLSMANIFFHISM